MIPKELCHYTKKDTALEKILCEGKIKLSQIGSTNDPKESIVNLSVAYFPSLADKNADSYYILLSNEFQKIQKEEWKVLCMTMHLPKKKHQNEIMSKFRHGWNRPTMWAHYAGNHSGVCIIFDGNRLLKNIRLSLRHHELFSGKVIYKNPSTQTGYYEGFQKIVKDQLGIDDLREEIRKYLKKMHREFFFSKFSTWKSESEYRLLAHSTNTNDEFIDIQGTIKSILVGSNFQKVYEPAIKEIAIKLNVSVGKMLWVNGVPTPQFGSIYRPKVKGSL